MITTKKISEISEKTFFYIPEYQRGYKWTGLQVEQLLTDLIQFEKASNNNLNQSYCLQPIVLKKMPHSDKRLSDAHRISIENDTIIYELIDGQQRLTTIFLLLSFLNNRFKPEFATKKFQLFYQTRKNSFDFLKKLSESGLSNEILEESRENIDFHHIYNAYKYIIEFFTGSTNNEKKDIGLFESTLKYRTKFIWYEVDEDENSKADEIFQRLNSGKVKLTNSELVKALILGKFETNEIHDAERMQMSIEWDSIESKLNNDEFWYFLTNKKSEKHNRISFLLDRFAIKNRVKDLNPEDERFTFLVFNHLFQEKDKLKEIWEELKMQFRQLHNWFSDFELFHYVGFLLTDYVDFDLDGIIKLYEDSVNSIEKFKTNLLIEIDGQINQKKLEELHYHHHSNIVRKVLLWFNISMILKHKTKNQRFNFYKFKDHNFDIEHIKSLDSDITKSDNSKKDFMYSFFKFYANKNFDEIQDISELDDNENGEILASSYRYLKDSSSHDFSIILKEIKDHFEISESQSGSEEDHSIGNLCLLDQGTNRGYKNAIFPIKRQKIIDNDLKGVYILPMTKSAFLKQFSGTTKNLLVWTENDSKEYKQEIINQLN